MVGRQKLQSSLQERINDYLGSFKSKDPTFSGTDTTGEAALDDYLLERAAEELRAAQARLDELKRELGKDQESP